MSPRPGAEVGGVTCDNLVSELQSVDGSHGTVHLWRHQDSEEVCLLMTIVSFKANDKNIWSDIKSV